jgi:tRNA (cytidine/uridine-2'-O-)-methyltransferase
LIELVTPGFNIVLYQPEIPANTGNIGRLCVGTDSRLHLIKPFRFLLDDKSLKRAGLDYWPELDFTIHDDINAILSSVDRQKLYFCTTKTGISYLDRHYQTGDYFVFGPESRGLPEDLLSEYSDRCISIPMTGKIRSLNLSNSVAITLYEAIRQITCQR